MCKSDRFFCHRGTESTESTEMEWFVTQSGRKRLPRRGQKSEDTPPRVFCKKSPQAIENKRKQSEKEGQESSRARKLLRYRRLDVSPSEGCSERRRIEKCDWGGTTGRKGVRWLVGYFMGYYTIWLAPVKRNFGSVLGRD